MENACNASGTRGSRPRSGARSGVGPRSGAEPHQASPLALELHSLGNDRGDFHAVADGGDRLWRNHADWSIRATKAYFLSPRAFVSMKVVCKRVCGSGFSPIFWWAENSTR